MLAAGAKSYEVHGHVTGEDGCDCHAARVTVYWQHLRRRVELGHGVTDGDGRYRIVFPQPEQVCAKLLIVVEAHVEGLSRPLRSALIEAAPELEVDLHHEPRDSSEHTTLLRKLRPLLDKHELTGLTEDEHHQDLTFLAREIERSPEDILRVVIAARLEAAHCGIPAAAFYAFLRQRVPTTLPSPLLAATDEFRLIEPLVRRIASLIFALDPEAQRRVLLSATAAKLVPRRIGKSAEALVAKLQALRASDALTQPYLVGKTTLGQLLDIAGLPSDKQLRFATALHENQGSMLAFWKQLGDGKHGFTAAEASAAERTLAVGAFVKNHVPLVRALLDQFNHGKHGALSDLAWLSRDDWMRLVSEHGTPPGIDAAAGAPPTEVFARVVYARVTRAFPTAALSSRLGYASYIAPEARAPLVVFFRDNRELDLIKHHLPTYLAENQGAFAHIPEVARPAVVAGARKLQRVLRITANVDTADTLLKLGIDSATKMNGLGRQQFFHQATKVGISKREANRIFNHGAQRYAAVVALLTQFRRDAVGIWPKALGQTSDLDQPTTEAIQRDQSLATLFGSQDYCKVDSCTSILSPAAYLCDLLLWLRNHRLSGSFATALAALDARRPDIRHLELDCANSDVAIPYIDIVNELLADAIQPPAGAGTATNPRWKQTSAGKSPAELRAAPEYFNPEAYAILYGASYPHTLPYSAGLDELRSYLGAGSVPLWQLRQALLPLRNVTTAQRLAVAAERFGLAPHDVELVTNANFVTAQVAWNTRTSTPASELVPVPAFIGAADITYDDLLALLEIGYVKGSINLAIAGIDDTCDTSVQSLSPAPLDLALLDRAHRFLRLWRKTGYRMWELDLLLRSTAVGSGTLNDGALIALSVFRELQDASGLAVDQQLALYQDIDTGAHREADGSTTPSLYARTFLNPAVTAVHPDADLVALGSGGAVADNVLANHLPALQAALGVSSAEATTLFALTNGQLTLANLSTIYRTITLARASKLSLDDLTFMAARGSAGSLTAVLATPAATLAFLQGVAAVQQSGFTMDALRYLLMPPPWNTTTGMTDATITTVLTAVRQAILNPSGGSVDGSVTAALAGQLGIPNDVTAILLAQLAVPPGGATLLSLLTAPALTAQTGGVFTTIDRTNFPDQFLAVQLADKAALVVKRLHLVAAEVTWLIAHTADYGGLVFTALPVATAQAALGVAPLLGTVLLVKLTRLFAAAPPASTVQTLYDVIGGVVAGTLVNEAQTQAALATITGWKLADITALATAIGVSFALDDYRKPATYEALRRLAMMAAAAGGSGAQLITWGATPGSEVAAETAAASALGALKALHPDNNDWLTLAPELRDPIRQRRAAALQAYLIAERDGSGNLVHGDVNALFEHFLIDTQMSCCEVTTRVIQAYIAVQIFVERCRMGLEAPGVVVNLDRDDTWNQWEWMKRYRIWEANRKVFLYPENWLVGSQRPNRSEIFQKLEQEVHQNENTADYLESVVEKYIDRLDQIAHLLVTGTCQDPVTGTIHVVARTEDEPPRYFTRARENGVWSPWQQVPYDIRAHQVVPALFRGRLCLFWLDVKVQNEPKQNLPIAQPSNNEPSQEVSRYVTLGLDYAVFKNRQWQPMQKARGKLFDLPLLASAQVSDPRSVEVLYSLKVQTPAPAAGYGARLFVDVFRLGKFEVIDVLVPLLGDLFFETMDSAGSQRAMHIGRAVFDGRVTDLELRNIEIAFRLRQEHLLQHAQGAYGPDAQPLLPLPDSEADPDVLGELFTQLQSGALTTLPATPNGPSQQSLPLILHQLPGQQNTGILLLTASVPFRLVGRANDLRFDPGSYFFYQDARRCYFVEAVRYYWSGSQWTPTPPSNPTGAQFQMRYFFHRFYHPFTKLLEHQLAGGGFRLLYDRNLQTNTDSITPGGADLFSFSHTYNPVTPKVAWGEDNEIINFKPDAAYGVYNWELFFHIPLYVAERLSQNQKFEDALEWFHYLFDPTRLGSEPAPRRFWIPKPLNALTDAQVLAQRINNLLLLVNRNDPSAVAQVQRWRQDPFNPYLLADLRPVAYMKRVVMSYLDNIIAWADNLFATDSREALSEATLLYVIAAEVLGPTPVAITPPQHAEESYHALEPKLDAFANAMVDIENVIGGGGGGGGGGGNPPPAQTFYFKIPPNDKLLGYWTTVADRLFKLRHCQNIQGVTRQLALFDAPIDPALLVRARAAGVDIGSVLSEVLVGLPAYRFTALYTQALDFVNAVRAYGALLLSALEKSDAAALASMLVINSRQLQTAADQIFQWKVEQAEKNLANLRESLALAQSRYDFYDGQAYMNAGEITDTVLSSAMIAVYLTAMIIELVGTGTHLVPTFVAGVAGFGGSPSIQSGIGGENFGNSAGSAAQAGKSLGTAIEKSAALARQQGSYAHRMDQWKQQARESTIQINQANIQLAGADLARQIAVQDQLNHVVQVEQLDQQLEFLNSKFTDQELYDWMVGRLADTYFQSYRLAYRLCKQVERCYRYELGIADSSFIQFGYWDSMRKGLLAGETLNHDLRQLQASYLELNKRRFEISRFISLAAIDPMALQNLLEKGVCDFDLPESLFDNDYPGHYNRHLVRMSVSVVYPSPGKFDNIKATLTLVKNKVRVSPTASSPGAYPESGPGDPRFVYSYAPVPQKIALGNAQDDPGLFLTTLSNNLSDQRYLPFEGAGAVSSWRLEMRPASNEVDLTTVGDVMLHLYYTALDGGDILKGHVEQANLAAQPTSGLKAFTIANDFASALDALVAKPGASDPDQTLTVTLTPGKFPPWTRGKAITVTGISVVVLSWNAINYVVQPQAPLTQSPPDRTTTPVPGQPNVSTAVLTVPANLALGKWSFKLRTETATDFRSLTRSDLGDVLLLVSFQVS